MSEPIARESPLMRFDLAMRATKPSSAGIVIVEHSFLGHLNLRGDVQDTRFTAAVREIIGIAPAVIPNTVDAVHGNVVYWLGPDEWLIVTATERKTTIERALRNALTGMRVAVTDVSGGQTVVVVSGDRVRELLAKGCPLDLHPSVFRTGRCAQTYLAKAPILIRRLDGPTSFEIVVRRSFADYFWLWLEDAAAEYGLAVIA